MSLLKIINKKTISFIFIIFFFLNFKSFPGNHFIFFIYHIISYFLFLTIIRKNINYFEFFFFSLLFLGFWVKPTTIFLINHSLFRFTEGDIKLFLESYKVFTDAFIVIIIAFSACIIGSFLREYLENKINIKKKYKINMKFITIYKKYRYLILSLYLVGLSFIWFSNIYFQIYAKGLVNNQIPFLFKNFFAWNLNYGLSAITAILIYIDIYIYKQKKIIFIGFFEAFFTNLSILSRAFLVYFLAYLKGFVDLVLKLKIDFNLSKNFLINVILIISFFIIGFFLVENTRLKKFNTNSVDNISSNNSSKYEFVKNSIFKISSLATTRWVGIDSLLSVSNSDEKSINLFVKSLSEKKNHQKPSFYMNHFFKSFKFEDDIDPSLNTVILPGLIAFLYYSGSYILVGLGVIFFILFFSYIELIFFKFSNNNNILASIIGFALAWRLSHFGYLPLNTFQFLISFFLTFIVVIIITKFVWRN